MRIISVIALVLAATSVPAAASAQTVAPKHYTTSATTIGVLMADPAAKAILLRIIPVIAGNDGISQANDQTLRAIQPMTQGNLTDAQLAEIDVELAKLPAK